MNMYGTGMNPYMLNHFFKVARDMNNYVVATSPYPGRYYRPIRDGHNFVVIHQTSSLLDSGLGGVFAYGLQAIGMKTKMVDLGYRIGHFIDINA